MRLHEIGEFGLIKKISKLFPEGGDVITGIGDDTAVIKYKRDRYLLFTTDMLIEGVHFKLKDTNPTLIGRKALAVNVSDIAAMGGVPKYGVVAFGAPPYFKVSFINKIFKGIKNLASKFKTDIVGGDTNKSGKLIINISLIGQVEKENLVLRSGAKINDAIFVTGSLGGSYESKRHLKFVPRVKEARYLVRNFKINSMIDISDGLTSDLKRITEASKVGALIEQKSIPLNKNCNIENALFNGEDFELLFTISERYADTLLKRWPFAIRLTKIGKITTPKDKIRLLTKKGIRQIKKEGFRHW